MLASKQIFRFGAALVAVALIQLTCSNASAQGIIVGQTPGTDFLAFEAEDIFQFVNGDDASGWIIVDTENPLITRNAIEVLADDTTASRKAAIWDQDGGGVNDFTHWKLQFVEPGDYSLYFRYTMWDINSNDGYGNEDSVYISSEFGMNGELVGTDADPTGNRDSKPSYYGNPPTGGANFGDGVWEGNFDWWNATPDGSDNTTTNVDGVYTPTLNTTLDFGIASRERGIGLDKIVFHLNDDLSDEELDALPTFAPNTGDPGDFNDDGAVNLADFLIMAENFNRSFPLLDSFAKGDQTRDGNVDLADFLFVRKLFNAPPGAATASIPEPTGLMMAIYAAVAMGTLLRRRRRRE